MKPIVVVVSFRDWYKMLGQITRENPPPGTPSGDFLQGVKERFKAKKALRRLDELVDQAYQKRLTGQGD